MSTKPRTIRSPNMCFQKQIVLILLVLAILFQHTESFAPRMLTARMTSTRRHVSAEEKKEDEVVVWRQDSDLSLPQFQRIPKMIVFDKDGTLGDDSASLKKWVDHMTNRLTVALEQHHSSPELVQADVLAFHQAIGWDDSVKHVVPSAPLAAGTWEEQVETTATLCQSFGLNPLLAREWHGELGKLHGADPPVVGLDLAWLMNTLRDDLGLVVAVCTSDDRAPTDASLKNWQIAHLLDHTICGDEVMESKPSAQPLEILCERASLRPEDCIVVGDTTGDTGMARNAGAGLCIGVMTGSGTADQLIETGADLILEHVGHIPALLEGVFSGVSKEATTRISSATTPAVSSSA